MFDGGIESTQVTSRFSGSALLVALVSLAACDGGATFELQNEVKSPDGAHKAVLSTDMGGGAAGWCSQVVRVVPVHIPSAPKERIPWEHRVFEAGCSSKIGLEWVGNDRVWITYTIGDSVTVSQRSTSPDAPVEISYTAR